jgi:hypothetical protein
MARKVDTTIPENQFTPLIDRAVTIPSERIHHHVDALRRANPTATPSGIVALLEKEFLTKSARKGGVVGATAAVPAVGTASAVVLTGAQVAAFFADAAKHVMAVADVYGVPIDDVERRRSLLLASLLGEEGAAAVQRQLGVGTIYWGRTLLTKLPIRTVSLINAELRRRAAKQGAAVGARALFGRLAPFGIGAVIGWHGNKAMAKDVAKGVRGAFGPLPSGFSREVGQVSRLARMEVR